jgi:peptide/nickel transport system ATP-binding protein
MMVAVARRLDIRRLSVELPTEQGWVRPVAEVSFALDEGESLGIVGESGSGKTMLALALMGLLPPGARASGEAFLAEQAGARNGKIDLLSAPPEIMRRMRGGQIAMVFQEPMTALNPVVRVGEQIKEAIRVHEARIPSRELRDRTIEALERAAVPEPARRLGQYPHQLSGGLRQRVTIAMALAAGPKVLVADEPTTALDVTVQKQILDLLAHLQRELQLSLLFITHDLGVVAQVASRLLVLYAGRIVEEGPTEEVLGHPRHPYTEALLRAAPRLEPRGVVPIPGAVPALDALPPGCSFSPRCSLRLADCDVEIPDLRRIDEEHRARCILVR